MSLFGSLADIRAAKREAAERFTVLERIALTSDQAVALAAELGNDPEVLRDLGARIDRQTGACSKVLGVKIVIAEPCV